jgi:PAS domain S-box-containing protein
MADGKRTSLLEMEMLAHALRSVSECVVVTDMADTILFVNEAFLMTYGYTSDELLGANIDIVRSNKNSPEITDAILPATLSGGWSGEVLNRRRNGEDFPVSLSTSVVRNDLGEPIALIGVAVDITERKKAEKQLVEAFEAAQAAAKAKAEFLAAMSHEIRTPMNGVIGMTELLMHTDLSPKQRELVQTIHACGENLLTIINDILDFSKIDSGKIDLESHPFDVRGSIDDIFKLFTPKAAEKGLRLVQLIDPNVPEFVSSDVTRFKQILINLVGNGIKFTEKGEVAVHVAARTKPGDVIEIICDVKDTGIGIPPEKLHRLFKAFSQVDASTNRRFGGTGLGLAISMHLVKLMGGRITVDSEPGYGSTFRFFVKTKRAPEIYMNAGLAASEAPLKSKLDSRLAERLPLKLLVVEDNPVNQKLLLLILAQLGFTPDVAENGNQALEAVARAKYDLIFMDLHMPQMDGLEATRKIRALEMDQPKIIAMTADALAGDREKCLDAGMDDYIRKPIRAMQVQSALERWGNSVPGG